MKTTWHLPLAHSSSGWPGGGGDVLRCRACRRAPEARSMSRAPAILRSSTTGQPLVWPRGLITYYTDQGDLSPILPNASANSFVAERIQPCGRRSRRPHSRPRSGGQLAEDVNGTNVIMNSDGTISMPADIQPTATGTPVGIVYDYDGSVTDALAGAGRRRLQPMLLQRRLRGRRQLRNISPPISMR